MKKPVEYHYREGHVFLLSPRLMQEQFQGLESSEIKERFFNGLSEYRKQNILGMDANLGRISDPNNQYYIHFFGMPISTYELLIQAASLDRKEIYVGYFPIIVPYERLKFHTVELTLYAEGEAFTYDQALIENNINAMGDGNYFSYTFTGKRNTDRFRPLGEWATFDDFMDIATRDLLSNCRSFNLCKDRTMVKIIQKNGIGETRSKEVNLYCYLGKENREYYF